MKKVLVISTSLRANSNSDYIAKEFARGAKEAGNEVQYIFLRGKNINFCRGCMACQKLKKCVINDDMVEIEEKMVNSDVIVFATPIYYYEMSGQLKTLLDRGNPMYEKDYKFRDIYFISTAADLDTSSCKRAINGLNGWLECFPKATLKDTIFQGGVSDEGDVRYMRLVLTQAYKKGANV